VREFHCIQPAERGKRDARAIRRDRRCLDQARAHRTGVVLEGTPQRRPDVEIDVSIIALSFVQQGIGIALVDGLLPWASFPGVVARRFRPTVALPLCLLTSSQRPLSRNQEMLRKQLRAAVRSHAADPASQGVLAAV